VKKLRWEVPKADGSKHRVRDTALVYAFFAGLVVVITAVTGGSVVKGVVAGAVVFVAAMIYSWWRWRDQLRRQEGGEE
jgi:Flp pilus assembly protein TadB